MNKLLTATFASVLALAPISCNKSESGGPTPGGDDSFKLKGATLPTSIKQGDTESIKISVDRAKSFHHTVKLEVKAPDKVHAELDRTTIKDSESTDFNVKVHPASDAAPGDYKVTVTGTPDTGTAVHLDITVKVVAK